MSINSMQNHTIWRALVIASLFVWAGACSNLAESKVYKFQIVSRPTNSTAAVQLVNSTTGQPVPGPQLFDMQWTFTGQKDAPMREQRRALQPDGRGAFLIHADPGDTLHLGALIPEKGELVRGSVDVRP